MDNAHEDLPRLVKLRDLVVELLAAFAEHDLRLAEIFLTKPGARKEVLTISSVRVIIHGESTS